MTTMELSASRREIGYGTRSILFASGHDESILGHCPPDEIRTAWYTGLLVISSGILKAFLFGLLGHLLLADDGTVHPEIVAGAVFLSAMISGIDIAFFIRPGHRIDGFRQLAATGGIELRGTWVSRLLGNISLTLRFLLGLAIAALLGLAASFDLYHNDIVADLNHRFQQQNAAIIVAATNREEAADRISAQLVEGVQQRVDALQKELSVTRRYLRSSTPWRNKARALQAQAALPDLESDLKTATSDLNRFRGDLAHQRARREENIQSDIRNSPGRIEQATGFLAQLTALQRLTGSNWLIAAVVLLIDTVAFALEMAPVLGTLVASRGSMYSLLVARDEYKRTVRIADELEDFINRRDRISGEGRSDDNLFAAAHGSGQAPTGKRPRGRPRKDSMNGGLPAVAPEDKQGPENDNERQ